nr:platelet glycoprotein GPIc [human, platelet, Peptide Partial, 13 aa] [Homo sapiens]
FNLDTREDNVIRK